MWAWLTPWSRTDKRRMIPMLKGQTLMQRARRWEMMRMLGIPSVLSRYLWEGKLQMMPMRRLSSSRLQMRRAAGARTTRTAAIPTRMRMSGRQEVMLRKRPKRRLQTRTDACMCIVVTDTFRPLCLLDPRFCGDDEEHDPSEEFEEYLACAVCGDNGKSNILIVWLFSYKEAR